MDNTGPPYHCTLLYKREYYQCMGRGDFVHFSESDKKCVYVWVWGGASRQLQLTMAYYSSVFSLKIDLVFYTLWHLLKVFLSFVLLDLFVFSYVTNKLKYAAQHNTTLGHCTQCSAFHLSGTSPYDSLIWQVTNTPKRAQEILWFTQNIKYS
jgi:hypothetical protein